MKRVLMTLILLMALPLVASAEDIRNSVVGVEGYDLVSYQTGKKPLRGNGNHVTNYQGVNYLFANADNKKTFLSNPQKYLPAYGGYCAFGASVGKKFIGDADVWEVVDGRLYLNLDNSIKSLWVKDIPGNIRKADSNWKRISDVPWTELNS